MHFRPFSVKKIYPFFFYLFPDFAAFSDFSPIFFFFLTICLILGFSPLPLKPPITHGSPIVVFYKKIRKKLEKNRISDADPQKRISDS